MISGGTPRTANETKRASGVRLNEDQCAGAIRGLRTVAGRDRALGREHRPQFAERFQVGVGARAFVVMHGTGPDFNFSAGEVGKFFDDLDRCRFILALAGLLAGDGLAMRVERELVLRFARNLPLLRDLLGGQAHAVGHADIVVLEDAHVHRRMVAHHRDNRHRLRAGRDHDIRLADADTVRCHRDGGEAGCAVAVDRDAAHRLRQAGQQHRHARQVQALLRFREGATDNGVLDQHRVELRYLRQRGLQHAHQQVVRPDIAEHAARRLADRGAGGCDDIGFLQLFAHLNSPGSLRRLSMLVV
jgi:hypothetical protein